MGTNGTVEGVSFRVWGRKLCVFMMRGIVFILLAAASSAYAATYGNEVVDRSVMDVAHNTMMVLEGSGFSSSGSVSSIDYYARRIEMVTAMIWRRTSDTQIQLINLVRLQPTELGLNTHILDASDPTVAVEAGDFLGISWDSLSVIPFDSCTDGVVTRFQEFGLDASAFVNGELVDSTELDTRGGCRTYSIQLHFDPDTIFGNSVFDRSTLDRATNTLMVLESDGISSAGRVTSIDYYAKTTDTISAMIWRRTSDTQIQLINSVSLEPTEVGAHTYRLSDTDFLVEAGDFLGLFWASHSVIPYDKCTEGVVTRFHEYGSVATAFTNGQYEDSAPLDTRGGCRTYSILLNFGEALPDIVEPVVEAAPVVIAEEMAFDVMPGMSAAGAGCHRDGDDLENCQDICWDMTDCFAIDFNTAAHPWCHCWIHTSDPGPLSPSANVDHYVKPT